MFNGKSNTFSKQQKKNRRLHYVKFVIIMFVLIYSLLHYFLFALYKHIFYAHIFIINGWIMLYMTFIFRLFYLYIWIQTIHYSLERIYTNARICLHPSTYHHKPNKIWFMLFESENEVVSLLHYSFFYIFVFNIMIPYYYMFAK